MLKLLALVLLGVALGYAIRRCGIRLGNISSRLVTALVWLLLFLLGIEVGSNPKIITSLSTLGIEALIITIFGVAGSVLLAWALWKYCMTTDKKREEE